MLGVIGAMGEEVQLLLNQMTDVKTSVHAEISVTKGSYKGTEIALAQSGIGKVNATICTQMLIDLYQPANLISAVSPAACSRICGPATSSSPPMWCNTTGT